MAKAKCPSEAQAKRLASLWADGRQAQVGLGKTYTDPTTLACVKYGWLVPTEEIGTYPSGAEYRVYKLADPAALEAIETYVRELRWKRQRAA